MLRGQLLTPNRVATMSLSHASVNWGEHLVGKTTKIRARQEIVSKALRTLALHHDPMSGNLTKLADRIQVHPVTLSVWINKGYVPHASVLVLEAVFGKQLVDLDALCPLENRRS